MHIHRAVGAAIILLSLSACARTPPATASASERAPELAGTHWRAERIGSADLSALEPARWPTLEFDPDENRVSGHGGCNRYAGPYHHEGDALGFGPLAQTKMGCDGPAGRIEQQFQAALAEVTSKRVVDDHLELLDATGQARIVLRADTKR